MKHIATFALLAGFLATDQALAQAPPQRRAQRVDSMTASITGKVVAADTGLPIKGAEVRLALDGRGTRVVTTNADGRYALVDLPAGDYRVIASRTGFISMQYGQRRPFEAAKTINLAEGTSTEANIGLLRGGVIYGRVLDQSGEPLAGTRVQVLRSRTVQGRRRVQSVGAPDQTDDTGSFRLYGLPPGDYYVAAAAGLGDQVKRDPPTYFPGTANFAEAQTIAVAAGAEASAEFQIAPVKNARVSGIVVNSAGAPVAAMVNLNSEAVSIGPAMQGVVAAMQVHADAAPDGTFTLENVPPGPYSLSALLFRGPSPGVTVRSGPPSIADMVREMPETVAMPLVVSGDDITELTLTTSRPSILSGSFVADSGVTRPLPTGLSVNQRSSGGAGLRMSMGSGNSTDFQLVGMSGAINVDVEGVPEGWTVKAILLDGRDIQDETIDLRGRNATIRVVMSDRPSSVLGTVASRGEPLDHTVVVFSDDDSKWTYPSRFIRVTRTDGQGRFKISDLPAGERYLAVAVDYLEDGEQDDAQFLERMRTRATSFTLSEGEQRSLQLEPISR